MRKLLLLAAFWAAPGANASPDGLRDGSPDESTAALPVARAAPVPTKTLTLQEFVRLAAANDTEFEEILVTGLALRYKRDLQLPARDIVLSAREELSLFLNRDEQDAATTLRVSKLFPMSATELSAEYAFTPTRKSPNSTSDFTLSLSQDIAENAFGRSTRLLDRIVGLEVEVARHQVIEAYEDYLARIVTVYLAWYEARENLLIGRSSYDENLKLLDNIQARRRSKIAKSLDVNKIRLQVLAKKERLVALEERYARSANQIERAIRHDGAAELIPAPPPMPARLRGPFEDRYRRFKDSSRTYRIFRLLEDKSDLQVEREADDLLPSISFLLQYKREGEGTGLQKPDDRFLTGFSLEFPLSDQVQKAEHETAIIDARKTRLGTRNTHYRLLTGIKNLFLEMEREKRLMDISAEKIALAREVLTDETENYTFAKVTLNDYIDAVNVLDNNRFNQILHELQWRKLHIEWMRITDRLVDEDDIRRRHRRSVGWPGEDPARP